MDASPLGFEKGRTPFLDLPKRLGVKRNPSPQDEAAIAALLSPGSDAYRRFVADIPGYEPV